MDKHLNENIQQHFDLLVIKLNSTQEEFHTLKSELESTKSDLEMAKSELKTAKSELKTAKSELENAKSKMNSTKIIVKSELSSSVNNRKRSASNWNSSDVASKRIVRYDPYPLPPLNIAVRQ